jgi:ribosomal protein L31
MTQRIGGIALFNIDGQSFSTDGEFSVTIQNTKKESVMSTAGEIFYTESTQPSKVSGTLFSTDTLDIDSLVNSTDVTVTITLANGKTSVLSHAVFTGDATLSAKDGKLDIEFSGSGRSISS